MITEARTDEVEVVEFNEPSEIIVGSDSFFGAAGRFRVGLNHGSVATVAELNPTVSGKPDLVASLLQRMASESAHRAIRLNDSVSAWIDSGVSSLAAKNTTDSAEAFRRALEIEPSNTRAILGLARVLKEQGRIDEAVGILNPLFKAYPSDPEIRVSFSLSLLASGKPNEALDVLRIDTPIAPEFAGLFAARGSMLIAIGDYRSAIGDLRKAVRVRPDWVYARNVLGIAEAKVGDLLAAERRFREAVRLAPVYSESLVNLAKVLETAGRWTEILDLAERYWTPSTAPFALGIRVGGAALNADDARIARDWLQQAVMKAREGAEKAWALNNLGVAYDRLGKPSEAAESFYQSAMEEASECAFANFGKVLIEQGKAETAIEWLESVGSTYRDGLTIKQTLAVALMQTDRMKEAVNAARSVVDTPLADKWSYALLGTLYADGIQRYDDAVATLKRGIELWPVEATLWNNLTYAQILNGELREAANSMSHLSKLPMSEQQRAYVTATAGLLALYREQLSEGWSLYEEAIAIAGKPSLRERLKVKRDLEMGRALIRTRAPAGDARRYLERAASGPASARPYTTHAANELKVLRDPGRVSGSEPTGT